ncbi:MAG TPA: flagellar protein FlaG [Bacillota bacterium]|mgnify:CR=1 FL=1|nr:flagellar protein FlaG [Bacillota bacterium]HOR84913.1 flagellar protein FlaG [Bacillota bacterium]HPL53582.1 flagellar protein FlaG [Bacillota bacterium]
MKVDNINVSVVKVQDAGIAQPIARTKREVRVGKADKKKQTDIKQEEVINDEMLENSVKQANKSLEQFNRMIQRTVHEKTRTIIYVIKDSITNEVIKEFPPKKIQDMIAKMWEIAGILIDERR